MEITPYLVNVSRHPDKKLSENKTKICVHLNANP